MIRPTLRMDEGATAVRLREIAAQLKSPVALYKDTGRRLANDLRAHFSKLDHSQSPPHGALTTHFWIDVRNATSNPEVDANGATVTIAHLAFAQKLYGGTITAKNGKALTIPIDPRAHGRRAAVFEQETGYKLFRPKGKRLLMANIDGQAVPIYALATSVHQDAEREALPPRAQLEAGIRDTAEKHLARMLARAAQA